MYDSTQQYLHPEKAEKVDVNFNPTVNQENDYFWYVKHPMVKGQDYTLDAVYKEPLSS